MRKVAVARVKDDFSRPLRLAARQEIVITRHGRPAGVLIDSACEDERFEGRLEDHTRFLERTARAREETRKGGSRRFEESGD